MPTVREPQPRALTNRLAIGALVLLSIATAAYSILAYVPPSPFGLTNAQLANASARPVLLALHAGFGSLALLAGLPQILRSPPRSSLSHHRRIGYVYAAAVAISGVSGLLLAFHAEGGLPARLGFATLGLAWLATTAIGINAATKHHLPLHRRLMLWSFALACAAVSLRLQLPLALSLGIPFELAYPTIAWSCWLPNLIAAELVHRSAHK